VFLFCQQGELVAGLEDVSLTDTVASPFTDDIREKLLVEDDSDQAILGAYSAILCVVLLT
jgi:hypothetical protein